MQQRILGDLRENDCVEFAHPVVGQAGARRVENINDGIDLGRPRVGVLLMSGLLTRFISIPFIIEMIVAILTTKVALYLGVSPLPLPPAPPQFGTWAVLHEIRSDYAQIMSVLFLLVAGPWPWSVDAVIARAR
jgi:hypothetical protein